MFIAAAFTNGQEVEATQVSTDILSIEQINKMWSIHDGMLFSLNKEILTHAATWVNLEDIILSEISQPQKRKYCVIPLTSNV